ncbi:MAG: hypothetical protein QXT25_02955 [Candidatus Anstonellaceae archaeon]
MLASAQKFDTSNPNAQNKSLVFFRQLKDLPHPDKKMAKKLSAEFRQTAVEFLRILFVEKDTKKAKLQASKLIATVPLSFYPTTVEFLAESFAKAKPNSSLSRLLPDVRLLKMFDQLKAKEKVATKASLEKLISLAVQLGKKQADFVLENLSLICKSYELLLQMEAFAVSSLQQGFASRLHAASSESDLVEACWYARKAISLNRNSVEKIEIISEEFSTSLALRKIGLEPDEARNIFATHIPDLRFFSSLHQFFGNARERIGRAMMSFKTSEAEAIAKEAIAKAQEIKSKTLTCEFQMLCMESRLYGALFIKNDLNEAIANTKEIVKLAQEHNLSVPTFVSEAFFTFAYTKSNSNFSPSDVRKEVLRAIPSFPSNQIKEIERLEVQMQKVADMVLHERESLKELLSLAYHIAELSFLAPPRVFVQKRQNIINVIEGVATRYEAVYGKEQARRQGLLLEQVKAALSAKIPDIYSFK